MKMKIVIISSIMLVVFACFELQAQWKDYRFRFIAKLIDADTAVVVPRCHIINMTQNKVSISDESGVFTITANVGDSIMFSSIGYERLRLVVADSMYSNTRVVKLKPAVYTLSELDIGLLSTYDRFKRDILSMEAQQAINMAPFISKYDVFTPPLPNQGGIRVPLPSPLENPISFFYELWSKEGKQSRYYHSVISGTAEFILIGDKFNGHLVRQLTGFENDELIKFMSYCRFTKQYILAASEMEIQREIMRKYREYIRM